MCVLRTICLCVLHLFLIVSAAGAGAECTQRCSRVLDPICALVSVGAASDVRAYLNACHLHKIQCLLEQDYDVSAAGAGAECTQRCSRVLDPICALVSVGAASDVRAYLNACHLHKIQCLLEQDYDVIVKEIPDSVCGLEKKSENPVHSRRDMDLSIVGARVMCNHTCPTHCTDLYDPVCAQVNDIKRVRKTVLINHCHADLLSCSFQQTVKIFHIDECVGMMAQFAYTALAQAATMKALGLMDA